MGHCFDLAVLSDSQRAVGLHCLWVKGSWAEGCYAAIEDGRSISTSDSTALPNIQTPYFCVFILLIMLSFSYYHYQLYHMSEGQSVVYLIYYVSK